jgi:hypothetical protein
MAKTDPDEKVETGYHVPMAVWQTSQSLITLS